MPASLRRTWLAVGLAALAVLVVGFLAARDFVRDVYATCPGSLQVSPVSSSLAGRSLEPLSFDTAEPPVPTAATKSFSLLYDQKKTDPRTPFGAMPQYANVRVVWNDRGSDGRTCACGTAPITLVGEAPHELRLHHVEGTDRYVVKGRTLSPYVTDSDVRVDFRLLPGASRELQRDRIFSMRHLSVLVALAAAGALVVALFRSRRAMAYALRMHTWTEARLAPSGLVEDESGAALGLLEQTRGRARTGPVLVASEALARSQLYRDMPIVDRRDVAEGTHARWTEGTMRRLRDARVLAVLSTACTLLAFGARHLAQ